MLLMGLSGCYYEIPTPSTAKFPRGEFYYSMDLSPGYDKLMVGSDQGVHVYQMDPFKEMWYVPFDDSVVSVVFSTVNDIAAAKLSGSERIPEPKEESYSVILFKATTGSVNRVWDESSNQSFFGTPKLTFSPDGMKLVSARVLDGVSIQNVFLGIGRRAEKPISSCTEVKIHAFDGDGMAWSPDGKLLAFDSICVTDSVFLIDAKSGDLVERMEKDPANPTRVSAHTLVFNSTGTLLAGDMQSAVVIWNAKNGDLVKSFTLPNGTTRGPFALTVAFSPDDTLLASGWDNGAIVVWNVETGEVVKTLQEAGEAVNTVLFYGNDRIITQSASEIKVWDLATGKGTTYLGGSAPAP